MADFALLSDVKTALGITDTSQDTTLTAMLQASTQMILDWLDCDPRSDDYSERLNGMGTHELIPTYSPVSAVASVVITYPSGSTDTLDLSTIDFDDNIIWRKDRRTFPVGRRNVTVGYSAGYDPMPKSFKQAALYTVRALYSSSDTDMNSTGESWAGVNSATWNAGGAGVLPVSARTLLQSYRRVISAG